MQFSNIAAAFLASLALVPSALADTHASCTCHNSDFYNWRITTLACAKYASMGYDNSAVTYNSETGRCTQDATTDYLMGDQWEEACQAIATSGFQCTDGQGTCYAYTDNVKGSC